MNKEIKQPKFLEKGDTISLIAPSFGVTSEPYATRCDAAIKNFQKLGYKVEEGVNVRKEEGAASSASAFSRANEFMDAYRNGGSLILSVGGGETMCEILPYVDFEAISKLPPKWFMGFSDNTNLCFPLVTLSGAATIYGPCAPQFYSNEFRCSELDALRLLAGEKHIEGYPKYSITRSNPTHPLYRYRLTQPKIIQEHGYTNPLEGTLLGGCLDCLIGICGTKYDRVKKFEDEHPEGIIWFLEACDLSPLGIRRGLFQLREAGWFKNAKGFLIGRPLCKDAEAFGINKYNAVLDILGELGLPILFDIDLGHIPPSMPIKVGVKAKVSLINGNIVFDYEK